MQSTAGGDVIRTWLVDENRQIAVFDAPLNSTRSGGYVTDQWVHMILMVDHDSAQVFLDGRAVPSYGFPLNQCGGCEDWAQSADNLAWPDPSSFATPLGRFAMYESYQANAVYNISFWATPGQHTITTEDTGGPNQWHGGGWVIKETNRDISGARSAVSDEAVASGTSAEECQARCAAADPPFRYMGLQWQSVRS